jgi:hypothetical protein
VEWQRKRHREFAEQAADDPTHHWLMANTAISDRLMTGPEPDLFALPARPPAVPSASRWRMMFDHNDGIVHHKSPVRSRAPSTKGCRSQPARYITMNRVLISETDRDARNKVVRVSQKQKDDEDNQTIAN